MKRKNKRTIIKKTGIRGVFLIVPSMLKEMLKVTGLTNSSKTGGHIFIDLTPPFDNDDGKPYEPTVFCFPQNEFFKTKDGYDPEGLKKFEVTPDMITDENGVLAQYLKYMYGYEI